MARKCLNCEARKGMMRFENETFMIEHAGMTATVEGLSGWRCGACGEVEFDADSAQRYAVAGDELVLRVTKPGKGRLSKDARTGYGFGRVGRDCAFDFNGDNDRFIRAELDNDYPYHLQHKWSGRASQHVYSF